MRVFLDDQIVPLERRSFAWALGEVRLRAERSHRVIVEATLDGLSIPEEALVDPPDEDFPGAEIRFTSDDPTELVRRTLGQVASALEDTQLEQNRAAELLQSGSIEQAMTHLSAALSNWSDVQQAVNSSVLLTGLDLDTLSIDRGGRASPLSSSIAGLSAQLKELKLGLSAQDWSGVADTLSLDLSEQADEFKEVLRAISDALPKVISISPSPSPAIDERGS